MADVLYQENPVNPLAARETVEPADIIKADWITYGGWSGLIFAAMFMGVAILPLPDWLAIDIALISPLFLVVAHVGLYQFLQRHRATMWNQLAVIFGIAAPVLVSAMISVQQSLIAYMHRYYDPLEEAARAAQINIWRATDSVQLGLDVAWDMFILPTIILFSLSVMKHPAFGRAFGAVGLAFGVIGLILNIYTFPTPPIAIGLPDVGPFVMTWYGILFALMIRAVRKAG